MATLAIVRRIALALPGVEESSDGFDFSVTNGAKPKGIAWVWRERLEPKKPRVRNPAVIAVRVANLGQKDLLLSADRVKFFTEPHYIGYPAVLVRLPKVTAADLKILIAEAWRCQAPKALLKSVVSDERGAKPQVKTKTKTAKKTATKTATKPSTKTSTNARYRPEFTATLFRYPGEGGWTFVPVPEKYSPPVTHGWGRTPVRATVDGHRWKTSVWCGKDGRTLLAVPKKVRGARGDGDRVRVRLEFDVL